MDNKSFNELLDKVNFVVENCNRVRLAKEHYDVVVDDADNIVIKSHGGFYTYMIVNLYYLANSYDVPISFSSFVAYEDGAHRTINICMLQCSTGGLLAPYFLYDLKQYEQANK